MMEAQEQEPSIIPSVLAKLQKWGDYASMGEPVVPSGFIPMKTPLSTDILRAWSLSTPPKHSLTVPMLLEHQRHQGRTIGMILDLSNHDCLYESDLPSTGLAYQHIQLVAKELPPLEDVQKVVQAAKLFWEEHPGLNIAVHCAYGFNRTGFVLCSFLIQEYNMSVDAALSCFAAARPPGVKHEKFKVELRRRYEPGMLYEPSPPSSIQQQPEDQPTSSTSPSDTSSTSMTSIPLPPTLSSHPGDAIHFVHTSSSPLPISTSHAPTQSKPSPRPCCQDTESLPQPHPTMSPSVAMQLPHSLPNRSPRGLRLCSGGGNPSGSPSGPSGLASSPTGSSSFLENESLGVSERIILASLRVDSDQPAAAAAALTASPSPLKHVARKSVRDLCWNEPAVTAQAGTK